MTWLSKWFDEARSRISGRSASKPAPAKKTSLLKETRSKSGEVKSGRVKGGQVKSGQAKSRHLKSTRTRNPALYGSHAAKSGKLHISKAPSQMSSYRAVSIHPTSSGCEAALRNRNTRFLATLAPQLPLGSCDHPQQCSCRYKYHADRRTGGMRRDTDHGLPASNYFETERRHRRDRRVADHA